MYTKHFLKMFIGLVLMGIIGLSGLAWINSSAKDTTLTNSSSSTTAVVNKSK